MYCQLSAASDALLGEAKGIRCSRPMLWIQAAHIHFEHFQQAADHNLGCLVAETLRHALDTLAVVTPAWLQFIAQPKWYKQFGRPLHEYKMPKKAAESDALADASARMG